MDSTAVKNFLQSFQNTLCSTLEAFEPQLRFGTDAWDRAQGGGGVTRILAEGKAFEKAGVGFSHVFGEQLPPSAIANRPELTGRHWQAMGVSVVIHPRNPMVPTSHANVRLFVAEKPSEPAIWWFGGGFDLTPYYGFDEDCVHWHRVAQDLCQPFGEDVYTRYSQWCRDYFYLTHRQEPRGIGGLFYDAQNDWSFDTCFAFMQAVGQGYLDAYCPIVERRQGMAYNDAHRQWQAIRRGRYVEFNLVHDRGTLFGLQSGGRAESILMSMPPQVQWPYQHSPKPGSPEAALLATYLTREHWL